MVKVSNLQINPESATMGMIPSYEMLKEMTKSALKKHRLEKVGYWVYGSELAKLTFTFSDGVSSPPSGTYMNGDPETVVDLPADAIACIEFKSWNDGYNFSLNQIDVVVGSQTLKIAAEE